MNRIVITGIGVVSPIGVGREAFWAGATAGQSGLGPITLFDASTFPVRIGGEVKGFDEAAVAASFPEVAATRDRKVLFALAAAEEAIADARLSSGHLQHALLCVGVGLETICLEDLTPFAGAPDLDRAMAGRLVLRQASFDGLGATTMLRTVPGLSSSAENTVAQANRGTRQSKIDGALVVKAGGHWLQTPLDATAKILGDRYGLLAGRYTNCSACAAGTQVVGEAWQMLRRGQAAVALAGAADSMLNPLGLGGFSLLRVLSTENDCPRQACRPFDATREGTVLGEGAAMLVLEVLEHARARGASIYAEVVGYGSSLDAFAVSDPDPAGRGAVDSMRRAIRSAGLGSADIDCVSAHGTGTPKNDTVETAAIKEVLGRRAREIPVHSVKSMTGHMIAASGAVEAAAAALTLSRRRVPPTINLRTPDPQCDLDYVPHAARSFRGETVLSNSFGFGGQNATIILRKLPNGTD
ncbi:MAG: beta-ketoacyl synthase N-terminal-like domain-containing protein [Thermoguttaceae bacterium]|jgi:3-oxoacyl-[acyl-carrier-protein] synthase II